MPGLDQRDYERLLAFRTGLRRFLYWSGQQAEAAGITPAQHQLLLAVRGHPGPDGPTIGEIAISPTSPSAAPGSPWSSPHGPVRR